MIQTTVGHNSGAGAIAVGAGAVWVANGDDESLSRIDPRTNAVVKTIKLGAHPQGITTVANTVWVIVN